MSQFKSLLRDQVTSKRSTVLPWVLPDSVTLDRRSALKLIGSACAVSALGGCVIAKINNAPDLGSAFSFDLSDPKFAPLKTVGEAVDVDDAAGYKIILIRLNEDEIMALDRICTHSQCDMKLDGPDGRWDGEKIICTCHNSHFSPRGEVLKAPATRPLPTYGVDFSADSDTVQVIFGDAEMSSGADDVVNPFADDEDAISEGEVLYQANCVFCHGEGGAGEVIPGADAFNIDQSNWSDGQLFLSIVDGIEGTSMPSFGDALTEEQCWKVVTYLRSLRTDQ